MIYYLDLFGVFVFAVTGSLAAGRKHLDLFGVVVLALATALGGGTLRDLILGTYPLFWVSNPVYIYVAIGAAFLTFFVVRKMSPTGIGLQTADGVGLAVFTVIGADKGLGLEVAPIIAVMMGVMTGVVGGMIRDVLVGEIPLVLRREIYATASFVGAVVYVSLGSSPVLGKAAAPLAMGLILALRLAAIHWQLSLPRFR